MMDLTLPVIRRESVIANAEVDPQSKCVLRMKVKYSFPKMHMQKSERICYQHSHAGGKHLRVSFRQRNNDPIWMVRDAEKSRRKVMCGHEY